MWVLGDMQVMKAKPLSMGLVPRPKGPSALSLSFLAHRQKWAGTYLHGDKKQAICNPKEALTTPWPCLPQSQVSHTQSTDLVFVSVHRMALRAIADQARCVALVQENHRQATGAAMGVAHVPEGAEHSPQ